MLKNLQYEFYTTNEIKPSGWLKEQLNIQAEGLNGNLDLIWPDVKESAWIGGTREGWERVPYWLDGFIPLAYLLEDEEKITRAKKYIDAIIKFQKEDGWIAPCADNERGNYDTWAVLLILKVLTVYADCSGDERIENVVKHCLKNLYNHLNSNTLRNWGAARWGEGLIAIYWLYDKTHEKWLLDFAKKLRLQGFTPQNWLSFIKDSAEEKGGWDLYSHVVNIAMMLKYEALYSLIDGNDSEPITHSILKYLDEKHGNAAGHFNGDECLHGTSPVHGAELCGVVEAMYSYEWLFAVTGNPSYLDRLEHLAFNSLPAAISPDMWSHQYDQMANQAAAFPMSKAPFSTNGSTAHTFGLEPEFGCCTANFGQGFPKFALATFMKTKDGIASCALSPAILTTTIGDAKVTCELKTGYPFRNKLTYIVTTDKPTEFTLSVRIPQAADSAEIDGKPVPCGEFAKIKRAWNGTETVEITLHFSTHIVPRPNDLVCMWRGPLLYSIAIKEQWERVEHSSNSVERKYPYCDYYIYPKSKWNYALTDDRFEIKENDFKSGFGGENPPVEMTAEMAEVPWEFHNGHCDEVPKSRERISEETAVRLVPYGFANLRMTEIPKI